MVVVGRSLLSSSSLVVLVAVAEEVVAVVVESAMTVVAVLLVVATVVVFHGVIPMHWGILKIVVRAEVACLTSVAVHLSLVPSNRNKTIRFISALLGC